jgi:glycosyltransferase involved in cell wall biosynthesis
MKTAQITHIYLPHIGGLEFYVKRLADSLNQNNITTEVLTTNMNTPATGRKPEARYFAATFQYMRNPFSLDFIKYLKKNDYDILHLHSVWFLHSLLAVYFRKKAKIVSTIHGVYPDDSNFKIKLFLYLYKPFIKYVLNKSEIIFVYSVIEQEKLKKIFNIRMEKIKIVPMAIEIEKYEDQPKEKIILFTGRIIPDKNPELLIKAVAIMDIKFKDFTVAFVGLITESYKKELIELSDKLKVKNKIEFIGPFDPSIENQKNELMDYYRKASVFVSLGSWEGQPTRLMEAMQFKTPVIAFAAGGTADFVSDNINGIIIKELNENLLSEKLEIILSNETLSNKLGEEARKTILNEYSWGKTFEKILKVYKE